MRKGMKKCQVLANYQPAEFKQALDIASACAAEGWFNAGNDCDHCPVRKSCVNFWDDFVVNIQPNPDHYLETIAHQFNSLLHEKHAYGHTRIQNSPPTPSLSLRAEGAAISLPLPRRESTNHSILPLPGRERIKVRVTVPHPLVIPPASTPSHSEPCASRHSEGATRPKNLLSLGRRTRSAGASPPPQVKAKVQQV